MASGNITRTPDYTLTSTEDITNAKINRVGGGTYRLDEGAVTDRELAVSLTGGYNTISAARASSDSYANNARITVKGWYTANDGAAGPDFFYDSTDSSTADDGLSCIVDSNGKRFKRTLREVDFKWAGAKGDGSTNDYTALSTAIDYAMNNSVPVRPSKATYMTGSELTFDGSSKTKSIRIDGNGATIKVSVDGIRNLEFNSFDEVEINSLNLTGYGETDTTEGGDSDRLFTITDSNKLRLNDCYGFESRSMSFAGDAEFVEVRDCRVDNSRRDAFNFTASKHLLMDGIVVQNCGDDAIAFHIENGASGKQDKDWIINNVKLILSSGIKGVGTPNGIISNIVGKRYKGYLIDFEQIESGFGEGYYSQNDLIIDGIVGENLMNLSVFGGSSVASGIRIIGRSQSGSSPTATNVPTTMFDTSSNSFLTPDDYEDEAATTHPIGPPHNILMSNIILRQYYPSATNYSDAGYEANAWHSAGYTDPLVGAFIGVGTGIRILKGIKNFRLNNFHIEGFSQGIEFTDQSGDFYFDNVTVSDGDVSRVSTGVVFDFDASTKVREMCFRNVRVDLDKYLEHSDHNSDGTWTNATTDGGCAFVNGTDNLTEGVFLDGCVVRNAKRRISQGSPVGAIADFNPVNVMEVVAWDEMDNQKGVGRLPDHFVGARIIAEDSDPTSATYQERQGYYDLGRDIHTLKTTQTTKTSFTITTDYAVDANRINAVGHPLSVGDAVIFNTTTTLPDPLQPNEIYWVLEADANSFELSLDKGNATYLITLTDNGTGTHTCVSNGLCLTIPDSLPMCFVDFRAERTSDPNYGNHGSLRFIRNTGSTPTGWTRIGSGSWQNGRQLVYFNNSLTTGNSGVMSVANQIGGSRLDSQQLFFAVDYDCDIEIRYHH